MTINLKKHTTRWLYIGVLLTCLFASNSLASPTWENEINNGKLRHGIALAVTSGVSVSDIAHLAIDEKYPVCEILIAMLKEKIAVHAALTTLINAGANLEHLAICCAEPGADIPSAVFAKIALDAGIDDNVVDHLLRIAYTPTPGESGTFARESVVAGGEIREGPFTSPFTFDSPFPPLIILSE